MMTNEQLAELDRTGEVEFRLTFLKEAQEETCGVCRWLVNDAGLLQCPHCFRFIPGNQSAVLKASLKEEDPEDWEYQYEHLLKVKKLHSSGVLHKLRRIYYSYLDEDQREKNSRIFYELR